MRHERIDLKRSYVKRSQGRYKIQNLKNHESQPCIQELHAIRAPLLSAKFVDASMGPDRRAVHSRPNFARKVMTRNYLTQVYVAEVDANRGRGNDDANEAISK